MMWSSFLKIRFFQMVVSLFCFSMALLSKAEAITVTTNGTSAHGFTTEKAPPATLTLGLPSYELVDVDNDGSFDRLDVIVVVFPGEVLVLDQIQGVAISFKDAAISAELSIADNSPFGPAVDYIGEGSFCFDDSDRSLVIDSRRGDVIDISGNDCLADFYRIGFELNSDISLPFVFDLSIVTETGNTYLYNAVIEFQGTQTGNPTGSQLDSIQRVTNSNGLRGGGCSLNSYSHLSLESLLMFALLAGLLMTWVFKSKMAIRLR